MNCDAFIKSNDTYDVIIPREALERYPSDPVCVQRISSNLDIHYYERGSVPPLSIQTYTYTAIPKCFGLLDTAALEASGILQLQNQPALSLFGQGILVGFIDTGIAYTNACFKDGAGTTRIRAIWDQTAIPDVLESEDESGSDGGQDRKDTGQSLTGKRRFSPQGFEYGVEYTKEDINEALAAEDPYAIVPQRDENGHGTLLASIACGSEDPAAGFIGAAPRCDIAVVKVKEAKPYLREFYYIPQNIPAYQENDIMAAVAYLEQKARQLGEPLVICLGMGTNNGSHSGGSELEVYLNEIGALYRRCVVIASGNEANARHHFHGMSNVTLEPDGNTVGNALPSDPVEVEINVENDMPGFYLELWAAAPEVFALSVTSPSGRRRPQIATRISAHQEYEFVLEGTRVEIDYRSVGRTRGDQLVFVRFDRAARGIWTLSVYPDTTITGDFNIWLPMKGMLPSEVFFLKPNPDITLTSPSSAQIPVTVGGYQVSDKGLYIDSGRGFTVSSVIKPDFVAPAVNVQGGGVRDNYVTASGTSVAAAVTAGACAQIMEWGIYRQENLALNSVEIGNLLIHGCDRSRDLVYPNTAWGYGRLNAYQAILAL